MFFSLLSSQPTKHMHDIDWKDMVIRGWGDFSLTDDSATQGITRTSVWTYITGDQHLSNLFVILS